MLKTTQLLATKFYVPTVPTQLLARPHLTNLLEQAADYKLTRISAPAGFGKTTLVAEWQKIHSNYQLAWISLDENDNELVRFLNYLVVSLKSCIPGVCEDILALLSSEQPLSIESALTTLINSVTDFINQQKLDKFFLVLDDYHVIDNRLIDSALTFLLEHMPPQLFFLNKIRNAS